MISIFQSYANSYDITNYFFCIKKNDVCNAHTKTYSIITITNGYVMMMKEKFEVIL